MTTHCAPLKAMLSQTKQSANLVSGKNTMKWDSHVQNDF